MAYNVFVTKMESFFNGMGLMTDENAILKRGILGALFGGVIVTYIKPSVMFLNGQARPWAAISPAEEATWVPWWTASVFGAFVTSFLV